MLKKTSQFSAESQQNNVIGGVFTCCYSTSEFACLLAITGLAKKLGTALNNC